MAGRPLRPATDHRLGKPLPHQLANRPRAPPAASSEEPFAHPGHARMSSCGITPRFRGLSPTNQGRSPTCSAPVRHVSPPKRTPFDLHALGTPPALILSQDQTLHQNAPGREPLWLDSGAHCSTICLAVLSHSIDGMAPHQAPFAYLLRLRRAISIVSASCRHPIPSANGEAARFDIIISTTPKRASACQRASPLGNPEAALVVARAGDERPLTSRSANGTTVQTLPEHLGGMPSFKGLASIPHQP